MFDKILGVVLAVMVIIIVGSYVFFLFASPFLFPDMPWPVAVACYFLGLTCIVAMVYGYRNGLTDPH